MEPSEVQNISGRVKKILKEQELELIQVYAPQVGSSYVVL
jgi:hypothetical protein